MAGLFHRKAASICDKARSTLSRFLFGTWLKNYISNHVKLIFSNPLACIVDAGFVFSIPNMLTMNQVGLYKILYLALSMIQSDMDGFEKSEA